MSRLIENPKELIFSKAKEILINEGYSKLSMRSLSKACDIALGTIYNYYPTKKDLIIDMMSEFWQDYFHSLKDIINSNDTFYTKLNCIFNRLNYSIKTFRQIWLTPELYNSPDYIESGLERENVYIEKFVKIIDSLLKKELQNCGAIERLGSHNMAEFIVMNLITMVQMPSFNYLSFELILKELLKA